MPCFRDKGDIGRKIIVGRGIGVITDLGISNTQETKTARNLAETEKASPLNPSP